MIKENITYTSPTSQAKTSIFAKKTGQYAIPITTFLFKKFRWQKRVKITRSYITKAIGCNKKTVERTIQWLEDNNVIRVLRDIYNVNIYYLTDAYRAPEVFNMCMRFFTNCVIFSTALLVSTPDVSLINNNGIYLYKSECVCVSNITVRARVGHSCTQKREKESMSTIEWGTAVTALHQKFPMTDHGLAKLAAFPAQVIKHATTKLPMVYKRHDPFVYFMAICNTYCKEEGIIPDWSQYRKMQSAQGIPDNDTNFLDMEALQNIVAEEEENAPKQYHKGGSSKNNAQKEDPAKIKARQDIRKREAEEHVKQMDEKEALLMSEPEIALARQFVADYEAGKFKGDSPWMQMVHDFRYEGQKKQIERYEALK